jgi:hypothetical protein
LANDDGGTQQSPRPWVHYSVASPWGLHVVKKVAETSVGGEPVRISSMVLLVAYAFYYRNVFSTVIYHHMPRERRCLRHSGAQQ